MNPKPYPLALLERLREAKTEEAARGLARRIRERSQAEQTEADARSQKALAEGRAQQVRDAEGAALGDGGLRAGDLQRAGAWELGVQRAADEQARAVTLAEAKRVEAGRAEVTAPDEVSRRRAEAEVVTCDRARWASDGRRVTEKKEEEAAVDAWRPRRS